jgi:hypothetical protein
MSNWTSKSSSSTPCSDDKIVHFPGRLSPPVGDPAGGDPLSSPASFEALGPVVQAVVMRLKNNRVRIRVAGPGSREDDDRDQR